MVGECCDGSLATVYFPPRRERAVQFHRREKDPACPESVLVLCQVFGNLSREAEEDVVLPLTRLFAPPPMEWSSHTRVLQLGE